MIQDIAPHQFDVVYAPKAPGENDPVLLFIRGRLYTHPDDSFFTFGELSALFSPDQLRFLFLIDQIRYYMLKDADERFSPKELSEHPRRQRLLEHSQVIRRSAIRALTDMKDAFAGYTGWHLQNWYQENRFCGCCGSPMEDGTDERKLVCPSCGHLVYPRINPAIIVAVHDHDRLLMTRYANRSVTWFVLIAGFTEIGESAEDTVRREVMEEVGVRVGHIRYFGSQPWGIPGNLTLGYTAELEGSDRITLDTHELAEAKWFPRNEVPPVNDHLSITAAMIDAFRRGQF